MGVLMAELVSFIGPEWAQEDDVILVTLKRTIIPGSTPPPGRSGQEIGAKGPGDEGAKGAWRILAEFSLASEVGNESWAMEQVINAVQELCLSKAYLERLKTAVAEATMNAIEHGNKNRLELPVQIQVLVSAMALAVRVTDQGGGQPIPEPEAPDLEAKLAGRQTPRGWGLFLIKNLMDEMHISSNETHHTLELIMYLSGDKPS